MIDDILHVVASLIPVLVFLTAARGVYHLFQLESYQFPGYFRSVRRNPAQAWIPGLYAAAVSLVLLAAFQLISERIQGVVIKAIILAVFLLLAVLAGLLGARLLRTKKPKKPFVFTTRVKRLYAVSFIILCIISYSLGTLNNVIILSVWPVLLPVLVAVCGFIAWGPEKIITEYYFRSARRKLLSQSDLIRIGITGSYGKTSVKHILGTILAEKSTVLITPKSFNTRRWALRGQYGNGCCLPIRCLSLKWERGTLAISGNSAAWSGRQSGY